VHAIVPPVFKRGGLYDIRFRQNPGKEKTAGVGDRSSKRKTRRYSDHLRVFNMTDERIAKICKVPVCFVQKVKQEMLAEKDS